MPDNGDEPPVDEGVIHPVAVLRHSMEKYPAETIFFPLLPTIVDAVRSNDKRDARITFAVSDDVVKNIKGDPDKVKLYMIVACPREAVEEWLELHESRIIRP